MPVLAMAAPHPDLRPSLSFDEADRVTDLRHSTQTSCMAPDALLRRRPHRDQEEAPLFTASGSALTDLNIGGNRILARTAFVAVPARSDVKPQAMSRRVIAKASKEASAMPER